MSLAYSGILKRPLVAAPSPDRPGIDIYEAAAIAQDTSPAGVGLPSYGRYGARRGFSLGDIKGGVGGTLILSGANRVSAGSALGLNGGALTIANVSGANAETFRQPFTDRQLDHRFGLVVAQFQRHEHDCRRENSGDYGLVGCRLPRLRVSTARE
jgi:hypothetical protein